MAQRTVALCDGKYIGIETIYTIIDGKQINIPDKLKELRKKSKANMLFCPCGCGTNLILVAGDKNLREQHYREKSGTGTVKCKMSTESKTSIDSRIVLKCWLDDKLAVSDVEARVPIYTIEDTKRKPEFTFLSRKKNIAIRYWRTRANIIEDRLDVLTGNLSGIRVFYIVDSANGGENGQYPEALMKIQEKQGYCLLLSVNDSDYDKAFMQAVFYDQDICGVWKEISIARAPLNSIYVNEDNELEYGGKSITQLYVNAKASFDLLMVEEKKRRIEASKRYQEEQRRQEEQWQREEQMRQEVWRQREEQERILRAQDDEKKKRAIEKEQIGRQRRIEEFKLNIESKFTQQEVQIRDEDGNRWIKCEFCGKIAMESEFSIYGGIGRVNLGTCKKCRADNSKEKQYIEYEKPKKIKSAPIKCPKCGGILKERKGKYGWFLGCSNYPECRYTM